MREDLEVFRHHDIAVPVLCGGAALTEKFTRDALASSYGSDVHYCKDAFDGLKVMESLTCHSDRA
jgi:5-methyltetrahydrofolate--homocysteine methyltransferase